MDFLEIDKDELMRKLIEDKKIDVVRNAIIDNDYENMIKNEMLNYCTDEELTVLAKDEDSFLDLMDKYSLNNKMIDIAIEKFSENTRVLKSIISEYTSHIKPNQLKILLNKDKLLKTIDELKDSFSDECYTLLIKNKLIKKRSNRQIVLEMDEELKNRDVREMPLNYLATLVYRRKFTEEEVDIAIDRLFKDNRELILKGNMDALLSEQEIPNDILIKITKEWKCRSDASWFKNMLKAQNLDCVFDYILKNVQLTGINKILLVENKKTSIKNLMRLYDIDISRVLESDSTKLPILDCHIHMA